MKGRKARLSDPVRMYIILLVVLCSFTGRTAASVVSLSDIQDDAIPFAFACLQEQLSMTDEQASLLTVTGLYSEPLDQTINVTFIFDNVSRI